MSATTEASPARRLTAGNPGPLTLLSDGIGEIISRHRLVGYLVRAEMKKRGVNTLLGNLWWVMDPLLLMAVYVVLVAVVGRGRTIPDYPLFIFSVILPWKWFTSSVQDSTASVINQYRLIRQIAFPKIVLPVAATTAGIAGFAFGLIPLVGMLYFYQDRISPLLILYPVVALVQYVFTLAIAIVVAAGNVFFRDLGNVTRHLLRIWFYLSPGLYSLAHLDGVNFVREHPIVRDIAAANPFAVLFDAYRRLAYGTEQGPPLMPNWPSLAVLLLVSVVLLAMAIVIFKRLEPNFAKVL